MSNVPFSKSDVILWFKRENECQKHYVCVEASSADFFTLTNRCVLCSEETGSYTCEYCGKQYKYFNPYQEHVALHAPMSKSSPHCQCCVVYGSSLHMDE